MTPRGDTATYASLPFFGRVLFVAAVILAFVILDTTSAQALDLAEEVDDTVEILDRVTGPVEEATGVNVEREEASGKVASEPTEDAGAGVAQTAIEPVDQVVGDTVAQVDASGDSLTQPAQEVVAEGTERATATGEKAAGQTVAQAQKRVSAIVDTSDMVVGSIDETSEMGGQVAETANSMVETTTGLTETVDAALGDLVTTISESGVVTTPETETLTESLGGATHPAQDSVDPAFTAPRPGSHLVRDPSWKPSVSPELRPSPPRTGEPVPSQIPRPPTAVITPVAVAGSGSPGAGPPIVFLAAALLLMAHIAPRLTEWLRLRPLIWRDDGLALAIERPG